MDFGAFSRGRTTGNPDKTAASPRDRWYPLDRQCSDRDRELYEWVIDTLGGEAEMTRETAGWHMSRASALDVAVELTDVLTAQLLAQRGSNARAEILDLRMTLKSADPDDPGAVAELTEKLASRIANLTP